MAALSDADRKAIWEKFMRDNRDGFGALTKADLRAAVDALDNFMETNAAAINSAIPQPSRGALSASQKAHLLSYVVLRRWGQ